MGQELRRSLQRRANVERVFHEVEHRDRIEALVARKIEDRSDTDLERKLLPSKPYALLVEINALDSGAQTLRAAKERPSTAADVQEPGVAQLNGCGKLCQH
jgi:hypothetical protein